MAQENGHTDKDNQRQIHQWILIKQDTPQHRDVAQKRNGNTGEAVNGLTYKAGPKKGT